MFDRVNQDHRNFVRIQLEPAWLIHHLRLPEADIGKGCNNFLDNGQRLITEMTSISSNHGDGDLVHVLSLC